MKMQKIYGRRLICLLIILALSAALFGCSQSAQPDPAETPAPDAPAPSETPSPELAPEEAVPGFYLTAEYDRLYFAPLDGSDMQLLVDRTTIFLTRFGEYVYASFDDGSVVRVDTRGNKVTELLPAGGREYRKLIPYDGGFIGVFYSFVEGSGFDLYRDGSQTGEPLFMNDLLLMTSSAGEYLYNRRYDSENGSRLVAFDRESLEPVWELPVDSSVELIRDDEGILCFIPNSGEIYRLDEKTPALVPLDIPVKSTDYELILSNGGKYLLQGNWSDGYRYYFINESGRREMEDLPEYFSVKDIFEGKALLYYYSGGKSAAGDENWYTVDAYKLLDLETGAVSDWPVQGQYGSLFAAGDFPVMDSSTARKPVCADIYAFFCEGTGAGGTVPFCSTTHNAWLNIADRVADVALLAAPTQEEQDYLNERGVEVEMKLYGGDSLVFIGNKACGVEDLSLDQVRAIYRGEITNWKELGGVDHEINVLYRDDQSGSQRLFERMLWKDEPVPDFEALGCERLDDMSTIVSMCLYDPYAIGYSIMTYLNDVFGNEDLLAFSLNGYSATPENVAAKNYPLGTQGYVVIHADEPEGSPARRLFDFFGTPLSDVILTRNGVTPLHGD